ncbi:MAG: tetratricopeptide repeat protein [Candidatus Atribacteria bacterium]|nr:tetratricopeptide repeat protein [Candidatus Atribacteria bacterium]
MKFRFFSWLLGMCLVFSLGIFSVYAQEAPTIAILPLSMRDEVDGYLGYYLRDLIKDALDDMEQVEVIDNIMIDEILRESKIPRDVVLVQSMAQVLGKRIGGDYLLSGSYRIRQLGDKERLVVSMRLFDLNQEVMIDLKSNVFDFNNPDEFRQLIVSEVLKSLNIDIAISVEPFLYEPQLIFPLYRAVEKMDEALRTYGSAQFPDKPLWKEAFAEAQKTSDAVPEYLESYYYLAYMYQKTGWLAKEVETWMVYVKLLEGSEKGKNSIQRASRAYLRLANSYLSQKKYDMAEQSINQALQINPEIAEAYFLLGKIAYDQGKSTQAQEYWNKAYFLDPALKEAQYFAGEAGKAAVYGKDAYESYRTGYTYYANGDLKTAEGYFRNAAQLNPNMKEAHYWLGRTLYDLGKLSDAEVTWRKVIEIDPFDSQAKRFLEKTIQEKQYGRNALIQFRQGFDLYQEAKYAEAIPYFERAVQESPRFQDAHEYLARSYYLLGQKDKYLKEREKSLNLIEQPVDKAWQYYLVGYELFSWNEKGKAIDYLQKAVDLNSHLSEAHLLLGEIYGSMNQWKQAAYHYAQASSTTENSIEEDQSSVLWGASVSYIQLGEWDKALEFLNELVKKYPYADFIEEAESLRIEAMVKMGHYRDARLSVQQFQLRFPSGRFREKVQFYYAFSFYQEKQWKEATQALESFHKNYPQSQYRKETLEALGYCYRNLGQEEKARGYFSQIEGQENTFLVADTFYREKKWQQALSSFLKYLNTTPQGQYVEEAKIKLASCYLETNQIELAEKLVDEIAGSLNLKFQLDFLRLTIKLSYKKGNWQKVVDGIDQLEKQTGNLDQEYLYLLAWSQVKLGKESEAKNLLENAGLNPDEVLSDPEIEKISNVIKILQSGDYSEAISQLQGLITEGVRSENTDIVHFLFGKALYLKGNLQEASQYLQKAVAAGNKDYLEEAYFYLGDIAYQEENWSEAAQWYQKLNIQDNLDLLWRLATSLQKSGKENQALDIYKKLQGDNAYSERAGIIIMESLFSQKKYQDFLQEANQYLKNHPDSTQNEEIIYMTAWSAYYLGDVTQALERISLYQDKYPQGRYFDELESLAIDLMIVQKNYQNVLPKLFNLENKLKGEKLEYTWYRIGSVYLKIEEYNRAAFYFEKLLGNKNGKYYTRGGYLMGVCLEYLDQPKAALKFYQQMVDSGLKDEWVDNSQKRISLLTEE